jgi:hypothetical protein
MEKFKIMLYRIDNRFYHFINALAQVNPLPNAARQTISPSFIFPSCHASHKAIGTEAAVVLP